MRCMRWGSIGGICKAQSLFPALLGERVGVRGSSTDLLGLQRSDAAVSESGLGRGAASELDRALELWI